MKTFNISAVLAAGLLAGFASSASAADLGGNCCADLEERIAELEATTARKGNRKVSLTVSGWVTENVMWWDDDGESNVYVVGSGTTLASNVKFSGSAQISPGWSAGYLIHVEFDGSDALLAINQNKPTGPGLFAGTVDFAQTVQSYWFVKSETLGKVSVGLVSQASDNTAILVDGSGSLVPANFVQFDYGGFFLRDANGQLTDTTISGIFACSDCNGAPVNAIRYDSPTFGGFSVSASWGQDDFWDIAARYAGEHHGFKLAVALAYAESTDSSGLPILLGDGAEHFQIGAYVQHVASGLFLYGAYSQLDGDAVVESTDNWYIKAGVRGKWNPHGATVLYGEYQNAEGGGVGGLIHATDDPVVPTFLGQVDSSEVNLWGLGVVQEIDAAAMSIWLTYRNIEAEAKDCCGATIASSDFQYVKFGALINF
jgi:hypothetical protein